MVLSAGWTSYAGDGRAMLEGRRVVRTGLLLQPVQLGEKLSLQNVSSELCENSSKSNRHQI
jgi:hypothetical protein